MGENEKDKSREREQRERENEEEGSGREGDGNVPERWDTRDLCRWLSSEGGLRAAQHK